jgi:hypothetical protein
VSNPVFISPMVVMFLVALPAMVLLLVITDEGFVQSPTEIPNLMVA